MLFNVQPQWSDWLVERHARDNFPYRRFRLEKPAPQNSQRWKCSWPTCISGMGLAGMGRCPGEWWNPDCPEYKNEDETLEQWARKHYREIVSRRF